MSVLIDGVPLRWPDEAASSREPERRRDEPPRAAADPAPSSFARALENLSGSIERGERIIAGAAGGYSSRDAAELIAIQAGIYRYSEAVDLTAKLVDRATSAVRTVLSGGH